MQITIKILSDKVNDRGKWKAGIKKHATIFGHSVEMFNRIELIHVLPFFTRKQEGLEVTKGTLQRLAYYEAK